MNSRAIFLTLKKVKSGNLGFYKNQFTRRFLAGVSQASLQPQACANRSLKGLDGWSWVRSLTVNELPVRSREEYCSPLLGAPPQDTPGRSIGLVRLSKHKHGCMIREYKRIGHFGMVSLLFFIFFCLFTHTRRRRARAFSGGGAERLRPWPRHPTLG